MTLTRNRGIAFVKFIYSLLVLRALALWRGRIQRLYPINRGWVFTKLDSSLHPNRIGPSPSAGHSQNFLTIRYRAILARWTLPVPEPDLTVSLVLHAFDDNTTGTPFLSVVSLDS